MQRGFLTSALIPLAIRLPAQALSAEPPSQPKHLLVSREKLGFSALRSISAFMSVAQVRTWPLLMCADSFPLAALRMRLGMIDRVCVCARVALVCAWVCVHGCVCKCEARLAA